MTDNLTCGYYRPEYKSLTCWHDDWKRCPYSGDMSKCHYEDIKLELYKLERKRNKYLDG